MIARQYIPKGLVTVKPVQREFRRYRSAEMCGPLPKTLYKVLPQLYARRLLDVGEMMWSTLTYFQHELDPTRERVPLDWAMTQNNLGRAIQMLRERGRAF